MTEKKPAIDSENPPPAANSGAKPPETPLKPELGKPEPGKPAPEFGGRGGPDPTRYGDWEKNGR
ncbi:MAG: DUF1674 domain-containing protein, partial [Rhodospirillales bacterium]|nr:DUF1674 domain-containing protein [Rhodospirillales bacterium]